MSSHWHPLTFSNLILSLHCVVVRGSWSIFYFKNRMHSKHILYRVWKCLPWISWPFEIWKFFCATKHATDFAKRNDHAFPKLNKQIFVLENNIFQIFYVLFTDWYIHETTIISKLTEPGEKRCYRNQNTSFSAEICWSNVLKYPYFPSKKLRRS